ncbi:hypothetical protein [Aquibaculum sediminis]|uniref:hypothetical protein n=1 Tax=Aquibaculum sediminis TaxID=3231907 RepID=UPI003452AF2E
MTRKANNRLHGGRIAQSAVLLSTLLLAGCVTNGMPHAGSEGQSEAAVPSQVNPDVRSEELIGLPPSALAETLGQPPVLRRDRPAEIWQYRGGDCVLDVFLYEGDSGSQVVHLEARDGRANPLAPQDCLMDLAGSAATG